MSDSDNEHCIHHYHHHIHHNSGEGVPNWLNPKKNGASKFFTKTLPSTLIFLIHQFLSFYCHKLILKLNIYLS